jgi:hypothetical protein
MKINRRTRAKQLEAILLQDEDLKELGRPSEIRWRYFRAGIKAVRRELFQ